MKRILSLLIVVLTIVSLTACGSTTNTETGRVYKCDYKSLNINTKITTTLDGEEISIVGNIFTFLTDPLTVKDSKGDIIGYAGDAYGIISQDDHGIYIGEKFDINMCGNVDLWGESYKLKNSEGNIVATVEFNALNTRGSIKDMEGSLIATYLSS